MIYNNDFSLLLKQSEVKKKKKEIQPDMFVLHYKEETETVGTSLLSLTLSSPVWGWTIDSLTMIMIKQVYKQAHSCII